MHTLLVINLCLFSSLATSAGAGSGKLDCPCAGPDWDEYAALADAVKSSGFPDGYGTEGCNVYDAELNATGCTGTAEKPGYCSAQWCYVEISRCRVNREECEEGNALVGSKTHPACRSRPTIPSVLVPGAYYSYETCGYLNDYDLSRASQVIGKRALIGVATHDPPFVSVESWPGPNNGTVIEYSGVEFSFLEKSLEAFNVPVELRMEDGWATAESRAKFSSSYTACVHDVAVGNFDVCIGDFWVTAERMLMTIFLPSFRTDTFYLMVFDDATTWDFAELLSNPFKPFSNEAWALIAGVVACKALIEAVLDFADSKEGGSYASRCFSALYMAWVSIFSGNSRFKGASLPAQVSNMGFQVFVLIVVASYKANLAKMLILRSAGPSIGSIDEAIEHRLRICIPAAIETTIRLNYPHGNYMVYAGSTSDFGRHMQGGKCEAAVIHQKRIDQLHGGWIHRQDCDRVRNGELTEEEGRCEIGHGGQQRDDCDIRRVGDVLLSVPIAFPVVSTPEVVNPVSWAITQAQNSGEWEAAVISNSHLFPDSMCDSDFRKNRRLGTESFVAGVFIVALAVTLALPLLWWQQHQQPHQREQDTAPGPPADSEAESDPPSPRSRAILDKLAEVTSLVRGGPLGANPLLPDAVGSGPIATLGDMPQSTSAFKTSNPAPLVQAQQLESPDFSPISARLPAHPLGSPNPAAWVVQPTGSTPAR